MVLSERLNAIAELTDKCKYVVDVGCDHGYVPISLVKSGKCERAYALDIRRGPLRICETNIKKEGLRAEVVTLMSDGLDSFEVPEAENEGEKGVLIIAGMGGLMIADILKRAEEKLEAFKEFILQPQSKVPELREYLQTQKFKITLERYVEDAGKYYTVMKVKKGSMKLLPAEIYYGTNIDRTSHDIYMKWLFKRHEELRQIASNLTTHKEREKEVSSLLRLLEEVKAGNEGL